METEQIGAYERVPCYQLHRPEWFAREDFQLFLETWSNPPAGAGHRLATWYTSGAPDEFSDVFVTYEYADEGSDCAEMPSDIWAEICRFCMQQEVRYGLIWIVNYEAEEDQEDETADYGQPGGFSSDPGGN